MNAPFAIRPATQDKGAKTYPEYLDDGRAWFLDIVRRPFTPFEVEQYARAYADLHCPFAVRRRHFEALKAARDAEFGKAPFKLTFHGLEKVL